MNTKRSSTVGQFLLVQLGLHVKLEDSSQGKTLVLVNVDRDLLHLHVSLQHLLICLHFQQSVLSSPWEILLPSNWRPGSTWSSDWEGFYSPPTPGSPWATFWKDSTKERCRVDLEWTESAQASLTGLWLLCSSRVWVTWNFFLFTCPIHLKANLHRRQLVLQVWFQLSNASTKSRCLPSSLHQMALQQISRPTALANSLPDFDNVKLFFKTFFTWMHCSCWPILSALHSPPSVSCSLRLSQAAVLRT